MIELPDWTYEFLTRPREVLALREDLMKQEEVVFDVETADAEGYPTSVPENCEIVLSSLCFEDDRAFVVKDNLISLLHPWVTSKKHRKIGHNALFDFQVMQLNRYCPMDIKGWWGETMYMAWLENCEEDVKRGMLGLKPLLERKFGCDTKEFEDVWGYVPEGKVKRVSPRMKDVLYDPQHPGYNFEEAILYTAKDSWGTWHLYKYLRNMLKARGYWQTYVNIDRLFLWLLWKMEDKGICIDMDFLKRVERKVVLQLMRNDHVWAGEIHPDVNRNAHLQKAHLFFRHGLNEKTEVVASCGCALPHKPTKFGKANPDHGWVNGVPSTDESVMEALAEGGCNAAQIIMDGKRAYTLNSNFVQRYLRSGEPEQCNGSVIPVAHTRWNPILRTGRISGRKNSRGLAGTFQNVPRRKDKDPYRVRTAFVARPGHKLLVADYANLELRLIAHLSQDKRMVSAFHNNEDLHGVTATQIPSLDVNCRPEEVKDKFPEQRDTAKTLNFAISYQASAKTVAANLEIEVDGARKIIKEWYKAYPGVKGYVDETIYQARLCGYVETLASRRRYLPKINLQRPEGYWDDLDEKDRNIIRSIAHDERVAVNTPVQGSAADIIKQAQVMLWTNKDLQRMGFEQLLQVHDEIVAEVPEQHAEEALEIMCDVMRQPFKGYLLVDLEADGGIGDTWEDAKA